MGKIREESLGWIKLAQDREPFVGTCECDNKPPGSIKCGEFFEWLRTCTSQEGLCSIEVVISFVS